MIPTAPRCWTPLLVCAAVLVGCHHNNREEELVRIDVSPHVNAVHQAERDWAWITGTLWRTATIEGAAPIEGSELWVRFEEHTWLRGSGGCNRFTASYERRGIDGLKVSEIGATKMMCQNPEGVMQQEARFFHLLSSVDAYHAEPERLDLIVNGVAVLRFDRVEPEK